MKSGPKIVLVIDDEREICELIGDEIKQQGYTVDVAHSGFDAIKIMKDRKPDVVISDFMMANGTGLDVLEAVNNMGGTDRPVFILVTGYSHISAEEAIRRGAKHVFSKPVDFDDFFDTIFDLLKAAGLAKAS